MVVSFSTIFVTFGTRSSLMRLVRSYSKDYLTHFIFVLMLNFFILSIILFLSRNIFIHFGQRYIFIQTLFFWFIVTVLGSAFLDLMQSYFISTKSPFKFFKVSLFMPIIKIILLLIMYFLWG